MTNARKLLDKAKLAKNDEFYTLDEDIYATLPYFDFTDKIIYCNCDDPRFSNFYKYFKDKFVELKLKRLIATYKPLDNTIPYRYDYDGINEYKTEIESGLFEYNENIITENIDDIVVVTNPPFSLYKEFFNFLINLNVKFVIICNQNALGYKDTFDKIRDKSVRVAYTDKQTFQFKKPDGTKQRVNSVWLTNLNQTKELPIRKLTQQYNTEIHQNYDNYNAINCDKTLDIPYNYDGVIGIPISSLTILNHKQYNIVDLGSAKNGIKFNKTYKEQFIIKSSSERERVQEKTNVLNRFLNIELTDTELQEFKEHNKTYYESDGKYYKQPYTRVLITLNKDFL